MGHILGYSFHAYCTDGAELSGVAVFKTRIITPDEFNAYRVLMSKGYSFTVASVSTHARLRGKASPDVLMNGCRWELKCPRGCNKRKTITRNINRAIEQMKNTDPPASRVRIILSALNVELPRENIIYHVEKKMCEGEIFELIAIYSEEELVHYINWHAEIINGDSHCPPYSGGGVSPLS